MSDGGAQKRTGEKGKEEVGFSNVQSLAVTVFCMCANDMSLQGTEGDWRLRPADGGYLVLVLGASRADR